MTQLETMHPLRISMQHFAEPEEDPKKPPQSIPEESPATPDEGLPKTQADLDTLIAKRVAREQKKWEKQQGKPPAAPPAIAPTLPGTVPPATPATESPANVELETANRELLTARAQLEAYRNGVKADAVEDAVYLALREAEKAGEADEDGIKDALKNVLKRYPEWKQDGVGKPGIKFGAGGAEPQPDTKKLAEIFGNTTT